MVGPWGATRLRALVSGEPGPGRLTRRIFAAGQALVLLAGLLLPALIAGPVIARTPFPTASLTVAKVCSPTNDTGRFNLRVDGSTVLANAACGNSKTVTVLAGRHTVSETAGAGSSLSNYAPVFSATCPGGAITLAANQNATCTITNTRRPTLTLTKVCVPDPNTGQVDLLIDGIDRGDASCARGGARTTHAVLLSVGPHTIGEQADGSTRLSAYIATYSANCAGATITLVPGQNAVCTITNTLRTPTLAVAKTDNGPWTIGQTGAQYAITVSNTGTAPTSGTITLTDSLPSGLSLGATPSGTGWLCVGVAGATLFSCTSTTPIAAGTSGNAISVPVSIGPTTPTGPNAITNTASAYGGGDPAHATSATAASGPVSTSVSSTSLTLKKICDPTTDTGTFNLYINGNPQAAYLAEPCGFTSPLLALSPGKFWVSETGAGGTDLSGYTSVIGGDCLADGTITLKLGDNRTCTITNTRKASLTVSKVCQTADGAAVDTGDNLSLLVDTIPGPGLSCGGSSGLIQLTPGLHNLSEGSANPGWYDAHTFSGDAACNADGSITLAPGGTYNCTLTNTVKYAHLTIDKACWAPDGTTPVVTGDTFDVYIDGNLAASGIACGGSSGRIQLTPDTLDTVTERGTTLGNYTTTNDGPSCNTDGTITLQPGDDLTCTISNSLKIATLEISKTADANLVNAGDSIGFTISVSNTGSVDAYGASLTDTLPDGTGIDWSIASQSGPVTCTITLLSLDCGTFVLAVGASQTVHVTSATTGESCGSYDNTADYSSDNGGSDSAFASTDVNCPSLTISKTADAASIQAGGPIGFTITLSNAGPGDAMGATLTDALPGGTGISWSIDTGGTSGPATCTITGAAPTQALDCGTFTLLASDSQVVHVTSSTTSESCGTYDNTAAYTSDNGSSDSSLQTSEAVSCAIQPDLTTLARSANGQVTDTATVSGDTAHGQVSGQVDFYVCGPTATAVACTSGGTDAGQNATVLDDSASSSQLTLANLSSGWYCFRTEYDPLANPNYLATSHSDATGECFYVVPTINVVKTVEPTFRGGIAGSEYVTFTVTITNNSVVVPLTLTALADDIPNANLLDQNPAGVDTNTCYLLANTTIPGDGQVSCHFRALVSGTPEPRDATDTVTATVEDALTNTIQGHGSATINVGT